MDNFVKCHAAVQVICSEAILPSVQKILEDWHQQCLKNYGACAQQTCPNKGKPNPRKGFCQSCVDWGSQIEQAYYPQHKITSIKWNNVDPTLFCKDPLEAAKVFALRLQQGQVYNSLDDFDAASLLMVAMHFTPFHLGDLNFYQTLEKVLMIRHNLCHLHISNKMELTDADTAQSFDDMRDLIHFLTSSYITTDIEKQLQIEISKIQTSPINAFMEHQARSPLSDTVKSGTLQLIKEKDATPPNLDMEVCRRQLREHYLQSLCKIPKHPGDSKTCLDMEDIYTNLSLHYEIVKPGAPIKIPLTSYHDMFTRKVNGILPKRTLVLGRGGSGKSTLFAKLAYDWAIDAKSPLKDVPLLFALNMRWMEYLSSVEEAILHQLLPRDTTISKESLSHYIKQNPEDVIILLDSYDEFSHGEILGSTETIKDTVTDILANRCFTSCRVLVSSRHWRASDFSGLSNVYAKIEVEGFSKENVKKYIMKNLQESPESGERLCEYMKNNNLFQIASNPLMAQLFCLFWKETKEEDIPSKITDLYTAIFCILHDHLLAKRNNKFSLSLGTIKEVVLQLGKCALHGLWPPNNSLVFAYQDLMMMASAECIEDGCKTGIISVEEKYPTFRSVIHSDRAKTSEQKSVVFFHKSAQEKCAGEYLSHLADTIPDEFARNLSMLDNAQKCLSIQMVLRFACGSNDHKNAAKLIIQKLIEIVNLELYYDIRAYYADGLKDPQKAKLVQEFIEMCLLCNYESGSTGQFNQYMADLFPAGKIQFLGLLPYTSSAIAHFLRTQQHSEIITQINLIQIPNVGKYVYLNTTTAIVDVLAVNAREAVKKISTPDEIEKIFNEYMEGHRGSFTQTDDFDNFMSFLTQRTSEGLLLIQLWEYFKTWNSSHSEINVDPVLDAAKFTRLNELSLINLKLQDAGLKLLTIIKENDLINVTHLILPDTGLSIYIMNSMAKVLSHRTPKLQVLDISRNNARDSQVLLNLTRSLQVLPIQELNLFGMNNPASSMTALAKMIPNISTNLTLLSISGNFMDDETGKELKNTLAEAQQLKTLLIRLGGMSQAIHIAVVMTIGKLVELEKLGIYASPYIDDLVLHLGNNLATLLKLRQLHVSASTGGGKLYEPSQMRKLFSRVMSTNSESSDKTAQAVDRKSWKVFRSNLQHLAPQMKELFLFILNLDINDLDDLLDLCREHSVELGYSRYMWPKDLEIPNDMPMNLI